MSVTLKKPEIKIKFYGILANIQAIKENDKILLHLMVAGHWLNVEDLWHSGRASGLPV